MHEKMAFDHKRQLGSTYRIFVELHYKLLVTTTIQNKSREVDSQIIEVFRETDGETYNNFDTL